MTGTTTPALNLHVPRPLGVWILTIWDALNAGVFPLALVLLVYLIPANRATSGMTLFDLLWTVALAIGTFAAALGAWRGSRRAAVALVIVLVIHYGLLAVNNIGLALSTGDTPTRVTAQAIARIVRAIIMLLVNAWYFLISWRPREFYGRR